MVSKELWLDVHHALSVWRWNVLHWIRQFLRNYAPFDVARRLHFDMVYIIQTSFINRFRWIGTHYPAGDYPGGPPNYPVDIGNFKQLDSEPVGAFRQIWGGAALSLN